MTPHLPRGIKLYVTPCSFHSASCDYLLVAFLVLNTPADFNNGNANVWNEFENLNNNNVDNNNAARPVINVTTDNGFASGNGTAENPYVLS